MWSCRQPAGLAVLLSALGVYLLAPLGAEAAHPATITSLVPVGIRATEAHGAPVASAMRSAVASEETLLQQMNQARLGKGLGALTREPSLDALAHEHATDMSRRGYFSHTTPEGQSLFDRVGAQLGCFMVGEMLAWMPNPEDAYRLFMASPTHRETVLHAEFGRVGIGMLGRSDSHIVAAVIFTD